MEWLLIVVVMGKRLEQQNTVEALNGDRDALSCSHPTASVTKQYNLVLAKAGK